jgi:hypothetical protein
MPDSAPIRGRWTIRWRPYTAKQPGGWELDGGPSWPEGLVAVVPVPDEAAIERGAEALREACGATSTLRTYRKLALVVLRAALETPTPPIPDSATSRASEDQHAQVPPEAQ